MTDKQRFYKLAQNVVDWPDKSIKLSGDKMLCVIIDLDITSKLLYWPENNHIGLNVEYGKNNSHGYVTGPKDWPILDEIIEVIREYKPELLEGIE